VSLTSSCRTDRCFLCIVVRVTFNAQ
jgi:hypothetical protein